MSAEAASDLASYYKGVEALKRLVVDDPDDRRGWTQQAFIHGTCNNFNDCQHGSWFFAPWHRSYLYYLEQLIAHYSGDANFALPYWDWSRTHSVPASFYGVDNPLADTVSIRSSCSSAPTAGRGRSANERFSQQDLDTYVGPAVVSGIQQNPDFATYGGSDFGSGALERTPHNFIHRWVGGSKFSNMVQFFSPLDPIFWLHHCNVDRLYSNWLERPGHVPPSVEEWTSRFFDDFVNAEGQQAGSEWTCGVTVDSAAMGYGYDRSLDLPPEMVAQRRPATTPTVIGSVAATQARIEGGVLSFVTTTPAQTARRTMNAVAGGADGYVVRLRLEGVHTPERQNTGVHVFIGDGVTPDSTIRDPGYVGSFTFFGGHGDEAKAEGGHDHGDGGTILLNASQALRNLHGDLSLSDGQSLKVSLVARPLYEGVDSHATVEEIKPDKIQLDVVDLDA